MYFSHSNPARFPKISEMVNNLFMVTQKYRVRQDPVIWLLSPSGPNFSSNEDSPANRKPALCALRRDAAGTGLGRVRPLGEPEGRARKKSPGRVGRKGRTVGTPLAFRRSSALHQTGQFSQVPEWNPSSNPDRPNTYALGGSRMNRE